MLVFHHLGGSVTMYTVRSVLVHITDSATNYTVFVASINGDGALGPICLGLNVNRFPLHLGPEKDYYNNIGLITQVALILI